MTKNRRQSRELLLADSWAGFNPGAEGVVAHDAAEVEDGVVFEVGQRAAIAATLFADRIPQLRRQSLPG